MRVGGESLTYHPDIRVNDTSYDIQIEADLGDAASIARYDNETNSFTVDAGSLQSQDIGTYLIKFEAFFYNSTYQEEKRKYRGKLFLTIWEGPAPPGESWFPSGYIEYE